MMVFQIIKKIDSFFLLGFSAQSRLAGPINIGNCRHPCCAKFFFCFWKCSGSCISRGDRLLFCSASKNKKSYSDKKIKIDPHCNHLEEMFLFLKINNYQFELSRLPQRTQMTPMVKIRVYLIELILDHDKYPRHQRATVLINPASPCSAGKSFKVRTIFRL